MIRVLGASVIRVLVVDDQPLTRAGLRRILELDKEIVVVGECDDGSQVLDAVDRLRPDVVMMDVRMPRIDGAQATRMLLRRADPPPVLSLTTFNDNDETIAAALGAGAAGLVVKDAPGDDIVRATLTVARGGSWLDPHVTGRVLNAYRQTATGAGNLDGMAVMERLTRRELEVLRHISQGSTNAEIAVILGISEATVKGHLGRLLAKLDVRDRAAAIVFAHTHGIV